MKTVKTRILTAIVVLMMVPSSAWAILMGGPGMYPAKGDFVTSANFGYRSITLLDRSLGTFDEMRSFEIVGKFGWQALKWLQPQLQVGATTFSTVISDFKSFLRPQVGLMFRMPFIQNEKKFSFGLDFGATYANLLGTIPDPVNAGNQIEQTGHKVDAVIGPTFAYCLERSCVYAGGRFTYLYFNEGGTVSQRPLGGLYGGVDYFVTPNIFFGLEAQNFDGDAIYAGVGGRF